MLLRSILLIGLILVGAAFLLRRIAVGQSILNITRDDVHFPTVSGSNLQRESFTFPADFAGELNILFVPFQREHQEIVNTWIPFAQELEAVYPGVVYYELPTIDRYPMLARTFINEGMRAGIPDTTARERTVTLYIDTDRFRETVDIEGRNDVHIMLVNRSGEILWRTTGVFKTEHSVSLTRAIEAHR